MEPGRPGEMAYCNPGPGAEIDGLRKTGSGPGPVYLNETVLTVAKMIVLDRQAAVSAYKPV